MYFFKIFEVYQFNKKILNIFFKNYNKIIQKLWKNLKFIS